ncbi:MAG TPA: hypothetical protein GX707_20460 [Epulopiscium sp.]|nr:hypothetical protein [Candidatus Epulonipiscium sp.]
MGNKQANTGVPTGFIRLIAILVVVTLGYNSIKLVKVSASLEQQVKETKKEVAMESKKLADLKIEYENIESLQTVESIAREKLGFVKEDEIVFREKY